MTNVVDILAANGAAVIDMPVANSAWAALPIGTILELPSNPDVSKFAPMDGHWVTRASCPLLSAILPAPQWDAPMVIGTAPAAGLNRVQYIEETGRWFLLSTNSINSIYSSSDGATWTTITMPSSSAWSQIVYCSGLGMYLAVGTSPNYATSTDLINWTARTFAATYTSPTVSANSSRFVMISQTNLEAYYSTNGSSRTTVAFPLSVNIGWMRWLNNQFVMMSSSGNSQPVCYSANGTVWTACGVVAIAGYQGLAWDGTKYILSPNTLTSTGAWYSSTDLATWSSYYVDAPAASLAMRWVDWQGGYFYGITNSFRSISYDGLLWRRELWPGGLTGVITGRTNKAGRILALLNTGSVYGYTPTDVNNLYLPTQVASLDGPKRYIRIDGPAVYA